MSVPGTNIQTVPAKTTGSDRSTLEKNIESIIALEKEQMQKLSAVEHMAGKVTAVAGSTPFITLHLLWFAFWISANCGLVPGIKPFDPFPFSFLTLVVSLEAIFLTLLVLMTQNRMTKEADKRAHLDLQINLLDEQETTRILRMVQKISDHLGIEPEPDDCITDLTEETDVTNLAQKIDEKTTS
jgi:uncharacterized membrane protein